MKTWRTAAIVTAVVSLLGAGGIRGQESGRVDAFAAMAEAERAFSAQAGRLGWKQAFLDSLAVDAVGFAQGAVGLAREQVAETADPPTGFSLARDPRYGDVAASGELGFLTGPAQRVAAGRPLRHQLYASIWKRQRDGVFKVVLDVSVPVPRAAAFAPGLVRASVSDRFSGDYDDRTPPLSAADSVLNSDLRSDPARAYRRRLADRARLYRPNVPPAVGATAILARLAGQPRLTLVDSRFAESARSGDLGYTWGTYQLVRPRGRAGTSGGTEEGFYVRVWTRQRAGQWQVTLDVLQPQLVSGPVGRATLRPFVG